MAENYVQTKERHFYRNKPEDAYQKRQESNRMDDIIKDTIIVNKIDLNAFKEIEQGLVHDGYLEKEQITAEYETIVKKQLQMLQADERGRQALQNEIADIRNKQEKRAEALRVRARALEIEKERAKKIANRPPPLPRSVRLLLKEQAKKDFESACEDITSNTSPLEDFLEEDVFILEDKENIDEEYLAEKRKMQEEWDKKAKKRFNEALKKDRQKQEHDAILKEIENAEKLNRRQMARNISEPRGKVPCYLPDKLHYAEKQVAMEDAVEDVFKKKNPKEHAIEDLENYQDKWEAKYKQIDSVMESKMVDCVPSFVKENYSYLLQEETTLQCGKHFTGLDDSTDLNIAFIESPQENILNNSKEIDAVISQLDKMRFELNEAYEKEFKPLLEASASKIVSLDKSVEANILKLPTEDKAIEVERTPLKKEVSSSSRSVQVDVLQGGILSYQRRDIGKMYRSHANSSSRYLPESFACQTDAASDVRSPRSALESWSSSSYWSLPSRHGLPKVCKFCDSPGCTVPLAEDEKLHKDCIPLARSESKPSDDLTEISFLTKNGLDDESVKARPLPNEDIHSGAIKSKLTSFIQIVADKYLRKSTTSPETSSTPKEVPIVSDHTTPKTYSEKHSPFSKVQASEYIDISGRISADKNSSPISSVSPEQFSRRQSESREEILVHIHDGTGQHKYDRVELKSTEYDLIANTSNSSEDELLKKCHEVITTNISDVFSADNRYEPGSTEVSFSPDRSTSPDEQHYKKESLTGYVYHDLSTIQEMDSVLTNDTKESSLGEEPRSIGKTSLLKKSDLEDISSDEVDTTSASLVDVPVSVVSEMAKNIRFIKGPSPEPIEIDNHGSEHSPLVSGTLDSPSFVSRLQTTKYKISSIQSLSDDQLSNISGTIDSKTPDNKSRSSDLLTPSPVSTVKSVSVTKSQVYPYSSSYRDSNSTRSHLTSTSALSKYFQDISSIRHGSEVSSKSSADAIVSDQMYPKRQMELHESSVGTFMPMTPQSYLSTPGDIAVKKFGSNSKKKFNLSSLQNQNFLESSLGTFVPLTPQSHLSTPNEVTGKHSDRNSMKITHLSAMQNKNVVDDFKTPDSNTDSFKALTPHSYFSSINSKHPSVNPKHVSPRKGNQYASHTGISSQKNIEDSSSESFKPLSLYSTPKDTTKDITSRKNDGHLSDSIKKDYQESTAYSNFQAMTPHSYFSSPSDAHASSCNKTDGFSTGNELKKGSVNVRIAIPNPLKDKAASQTQEEIGTSQGPKSFTYPIQLRLDVQDFVKSPKDIKDYKMDGRNLPMETQSSKQTSGSSPNKNYADSVNTTIGHIAKDDKAVKVPSAGFVPHLTPEDFTPSEREFFAAKMSAADKTDRPKNSNEYISNSKSSSKKSAFINNYLRNKLEKLPNSSSSVEKEREYLSSTLSEISSTSPNPILQALAQQINYSGKFRSPYTTPSNGSSTENLSEAFGESKITYQSTPIKSIEEIIQETGILEEPSLTLMNMELTIKPDTPEKPGQRSESCSLPSDDFKTPSSLQSGFLTPSTMETPSDATSSPYGCDSPSMISFLKHEQSCLTPVDVEGNKLASKKTPQNEYKKRTIRLWNNLQEVQAKRLLEERREQMRKNRLKMKSYSKKITTPRKTPSG